MSHSPSIINPLVIGCGFLGTRLARVLQQAGQNPLVTSRSAQNCAGLASGSLDVVRFDINTPDSWGELARRMRSDHQVFLMVPPSQVDLDLLPDLVQEVFVGKVARLLLVSSTVVYGEVDGWVSADSPVSLDSERSRRQYAIEQCLAGQDITLNVVRLAGLYGAGRIIGKQTLLRGDKLTGHPDGTLNLVHVDDAVDLLLAVMRNQVAASVELGADGNPVTRRRYYTDLATALGCAPPVFAAASGPSPSSRRCDIRPTVARTGWRPGHTDYRTAFPGA